jgi:hypothetical protein
LITVAHRKCSLTKVNEHFKRSNYKKKRKDNR